MKKTLLIVLLLMLAVMLFSCEGEAHTHTWGEPTVAANGDKTYTCSGCTETKTEPHEHDYIIGWVSDDSTHWYACKLEGCTARGGEQAHAWGEPVVTVTPSEDAEGEQTLTCTVCERTKKEAIAKLPAKMSREDWEAAFAFENVKVDRYIWIGESADRMAYWIDGDIVQMIEGDESVYVERGSALLEFDFSEFYDAFVHDGEGFYTAERVEVLEETVICIDVAIDFVDGRIESIQYEVEGWGEMRYGYYFSEWGKVELSLPTLSAKVLADAFDPANFENYTVSIIEYAEDAGLLSSKEWMFDGDSFYCYTVDAEWNEQEEQGTLTDAGWVKLPELATLVEILDASLFVHDPEAMDFCCTERIESFMGTGTDIVELHLWIEDGMLSYIEMLTADDVSIGYYFGDYGTTEISVD